MLANVNFTVASPRLCVRVLDATFVQIGIESTWKNLFRDRTSFDSFFDNWQTRTVLMMSGVTRKVIWVGETKSAPADLVWLLGETVNSKLHEYLCFSAPCTDWKLKVEPGSLFFCRVVLFGAWAVFWAVQRWMQKNSSISSSLAPNF